MPGVTCKIIMVSIPLCTAALCSALLAPCMGMDVSTLVYNIEQASPRHRRAMVLAFPHAVLAVLAFFGQCVECWFCQLLSFYDARAIAQTGAVQRHNYSKTTHNIAF